MKLSMRQRHLVYGALAALAVLTVFFVCDTPVWALPSCTVLVVFAGQTASINMSGETLNFNYDAVSNMVSVTGGSAGSSSFTSTVGGTFWCSVWGDCKTIAVTPYFVVFFLRPLTVLKILGIEYAI